MTARLEVDAVTKRFGGLTAVDAVSFDLPDDTVLGLIGPNGSGKTTLLSVLAGTHDPDSGSVRLSGDAISGHGPRRCVRAGVGRTFQTTRLLRSWTLRETMRLAERELDRGSRTAVRPGIDDIAALLGLAEVLDQPTASLTSASQRLAMIANALSTAPRVLLLDEPAVGMDPSETALLATAIRRVRDQLGVSVIVVEHNMHFLMALADTVVVMASGRILATGTPSQVRSDESVIATYLGS